MPKLSDPITIGNMSLSHRIVMAPMTRFRSDTNHIPQPMVVDYYAQRASPGGLQITEATYISHSSCGRHANAPGIYTPAQINAWRTVTDAVHAKGGYIFMQLWHVGRAGRPEVLKAEGLEMVSSSAVPMPPRNGETYDTPRPMTEDEIWTCIADFAQASRNAIDAGFDGIEIHATNGYLVDQFLQDVCNQRTDSWGGSVENRSRFCVEVVKAACDAVGPKRVGVRLCPHGQFQGMGMKDPVPQFTDVISRMKVLGLAYLHLIEPRISGNIDREVEEHESLDFALRAWDHAGPALLAGGYTPETAKKAVEETHKDKQVAIVFGRRFISNPDLPDRVIQGIELSEYDRSTFYTVQSRHGYTDYPFHSTVKA